MKSLDSGEEKIRFLEIKIDNLESKVQETADNNCERSKEKERSSDNCQVCEKSSQSVNNLKKHPNGTPGVKCKVCGNSFVKNSDLEL